ncbi:MAG: hypothetical protein BWY95_01888 [Bacteroidetes bacterium ADurb.BinA104]|nr:MAG: hypothetical protein BWY95_01888 [Bacteroidetes bacterium ADurb.BinA104]
MIGCGSAYTDTARGAIMVVKQAAADSQVGKAFPYRCPEVPGSFVSYTCISTEQL